MIHEILKTKNYNFEPFFEDGDSGQIYKATNKYNKNDCWIVKHTYLDCCFNEYIYYFFASKLNITVPETHLFISDDDNRNLFNSIYIIGHQYIEENENFKSLITYEKLKKDKCVNLKEYYRMQALKILLDESDGIEYLYGKNHILYRIDTTDTFFSNLCYIIIKEEKKVLNQRNYLDNYLKINSSNLVDYISIYLNNKDYYNNLKNDLYDLSIKIINLPINIFDDILITLCSVYDYPHIELLELFHHYLKNLKNTCEIIKNNILNNIYD